jgi:3-oxoacyl-[acyl-carrier protein] reductase
MDLELKGKVALISGAGQGVGREICKVLAAEGAKVAVNDLFQEKADKVAKEIKDTGGIAIGVQADVTNLDQVKAMVARVGAEFGPVNILVNNAGVPWEVRTGQIKRTVFVESEPVLWKKQIDLNMHGCLNCVHSVLASMVERKEGKILSIIS